MRRIFQFPPKHLGEQAKFYFRDHRIHRRSSPQRNTICKSFAGLGPLRAGESGGSDSVPPGSLRRGMRARPRRRTVPRWHCTGWLAVPAAGIN
eukprot:765737-Hanusia_phi.AAC.3